MTTTADYLEEAAAELRKARAANERNAGDKFMVREVREERMRIAEAFTRLAEIEAGLSLQEADNDGNAGEAELQARAS